MTLRSCIVRDPDTGMTCGGLTRKTRCPFHERTSPRNHGGKTRQDRGYGADYQRGRAALMGEPCAMGLPGCTGIATTAQHEHGRLVPACAHCNYADGARRMRERNAYET